MRRPDSGTALLKLVLVAFLWGGTFIAGRIASAYLSPLDNASLRFLVAGAGSIVLLSTTRAWRPMRRKETILVALMGLTGIVSYNLCFFAGLRHIEANRAALIVATNPAMTMLAARVALGEALGARKALGIAISLAGAVLVITDGRIVGSPAAGWGELLIFGSVASWVCYTLLARSALHQLSSVVASAYSTLIGMAVLLVFSVPGVQVAQLAAVSWQAWASLVFLGLLGTTVAFKLYMDGVSSLGAGRAAQFINLVPVFAVAQSMLILGERPSAASLAGGALVVLGLIVSQRSAAPRSV
jgi:drug/metabolite transporter (DMT)-like permease